MRFSIRELLALAVVAALGMLAWQSHQRALEEQLRATAIASEVERLRAELHMDNAELHQANLSAADEYASIHEMRERALVHFDLLDKKYGSVQPKGDDVFSVRSLPSIQIDATGPPIRFRMIVPQARPIWLNFGVHAVKKDTSSSRRAGQESDLLKISPFEISGPLEMRLPAGEHLLEIAASTDDSPSLPITITLDKEPLLQTAYVSKGARRGGSMSISMPQQSDYDTKRELPWLASVSLRPTEPKPGQTQHGFSLWVSDHSSNFSEFPKK